MEKQEEYLQSSLWYREPIIDPYQVIARFFDHMTISDCRKKVKRLVLAAGSAKAYRKDSPGNIIYFFKMIESVINAAYLINQEKKKSRLILMRVISLTRNSIVED